MRALLRPGVVFPDPDPATERAWLGAVHVLAREHGGRVVGEVQHPDAGRNHSSVVVALDRLLTVVLNTGARLVAGLDGPLPHPAAARYVDLPHAAAFDLVGLRVARADELEEALTDDHLRALPAQETEQVRYHRASRVGEVLVSWFD